MSKSYLLLLLIALGLSGLIGCSKGERAAADQEAKTMRESFASAPEELKAKYEAANAALQKGDFLTAKTALDDLQQKAAQLSPKQQGAMLELKEAIMAKAVIAAQNGDQTAVKAIQELRSQSRSR